jgi:very-short-patch-repair endonuclease
MSFTPRRQISRARSLRGADTPAEARLWTNLRGRKLQKFKFVRQAPIGPYIVDGATHSEDREIAYDRKREVFLKAEGYQIVRVQNDDIYKHITTCPPLQLRR